jgi:hypothetical protein
VISDEVTVASCVFWVIVVAWLPSLASHSARLQPHSRSTSVVSTAMSPANDYWSVARIGLSPYRRYHCAENYNRCSLGRIGCPNSWPICSLLGSDVL